MGKISLILTTIAFAAIWAAPSHAEEMIAEAEGCLNMNGTIYDGCMCNFTEYSWNNGVITNRRRCVKISGLACI